MTHTLGVKKVKASVLEPGICHPIQIPFPTMQEPLQPRKTLGPARIWSTSP